jgi:hypothetical protein
MRQWQRREGGRHCISYIPMVLLFISVLVTSSSDVSSGFVGDEAAFRAFRFNHGSTHVDFCRTLVAEAAQPNSGCAASIPNHPSRYLKPERHAKSASSPPLSSSSSFGSGKRSSSCSSDDIFLWDPSLHSSEPGELAAALLSTRRFLSEVVYACKLHSSFIS